MATKTFNSRFKQKIDTFANWTAANPVLLEGELAVVTIPAEAALGMNKPAVMLKVGDGATNFNDLAWASALAGDVAAWAKASQKPGYSASEISGLDEHIARKINDTDTQYRLVKVSDTEFKLQSKALNGDNFTDVDCDHIIIPDFDTAELEGAIGEAKTTADAAKIAADAAKIAADTANEAIAILNGEGAGSVKKIAESAAADAAAKIVGDAPEAYDTLKEIADFILTDVTGAAGLTAQVTANKEALGVLNGTGAGSVADAKKAGTDAAAAAEGAKTAADAAQTAADAADTKAGNAATAAANAAQAVTDLNNSLHAIAKSGNVNDLVQSTGDYFVFSAGSATDLV